MLAIPKADSNSFSLPWARISSLGEANAQEIAEKSQTRVVVSMDLVPLATGNGWFIAWRGRCLDILTQAKAEWPLDSRIVLDLVDS